MIEEYGTVVRIERDAIWVETLQKSACGSCRAQKGCGQHVLGKVFSSRTSIRVLLSDVAAETISLEQQVTIGIPEEVVVKASLMVYLTPLLLLLLGALAGFWLHASDGFAVAGAVAGLLIGGAVVRWHAWAHRDDPRFQPVLLTVA